MEGILFLIFGSVVVGAGLIFLLAIADKKHPRTTSSSASTLSIEIFEKASLDIVEGMKLEIDSIHQTNAGELDIQAHNPTPYVGGRFVIHALYLPAGEIVSHERILELSNTIIQDRASKGLFLTTGMFPKDLESIGELAPIEFIDGENFRTLIQKYNPALLHQ